MIDFSRLPIDDKVKRQLSKFKIDFAFQPIFQFGDSKPFAYEALMRPENFSTPEQLIDFFMLQGDLHSVEVATLYGAALAYSSRNIDAKFCVNSFPCECLRDDELETFFKCFPNIEDKIIVELLEYPKFSPLHWSVKNRQIKEHGLVKLAVDDFGSGINNMEAVDIFQPDVVKIDRALLKNIHSDVQMQKSFNYYVEEFHKRGIKVLAEGVELKEEYEYIKTVGVEYYQGFYLGEPTIDKMMR